jgi:rubrerythrin
MKKIRIPLPKQTEKVHHSAKDYKRQNNKKLYIEWEIECPKCGTFTQIQKSEPVLCPQCLCPDIDTSIKDT